MREFSEIKKIRVNCPSCGCMFYPKMRDKRNKLKNAGIELYIGTCKRCQKPHSFVKFTFNTDTLKGKLKMKRAKFMLKKLKEYTTL